MIAVSNQDIAGVLLPENRAAAQERFAVAK